MKGVNNVKPSQLILAMTGSVLLSWLFVSGTPCLGDGTDGREGRRYTPYDEVLSNSVVVILGQVVSCEIVNLKRGTEAGVRMVTHKDSMGVEYTECAVDADWLLEKLLSPSSVWTCRAMVRVKGVFAGSAKVDELLAVDIVYGVREDAVRSFTNEPSARDFVSGRSCAVIHLRKKNSKPDATYSLVTFPWEVKEMDIPGRSKEMETMLERYQRLLAIDNYVARFKSLTPSESDDLLALVGSRKPGMAKVNFSPAGAKTLIELSNHRQPTAENQQLWQRWWQRERGQFVEMPFRVLRPVR